MWDLIITLIIFTDLNFSMVRMILEAADRRDTRYMNKKSIKVLKKLIFGDPGELNLQVRMG